MVVQQTPPVAVLMTGASDQWREVVTNLGRLGKYAKPDELETRA